MDRIINNICVFGLGSAGSNVIQHLAYAMPQVQLTGIDCDIVEQRNFEVGTQPYSRADLGRPKTQAMQRILQSSTKSSMKAFHRKVSSSSQICDMAGRGVNDVLLIDAFDNAESRNLFLPLKGVYPILHIGFSPKLTGEVVWAESYAEMTPDSDGAFDICLAALARPFIHALTSIASLAVVDFVNKGTKRNVYFDSQLKCFTF